MACVGLFLGKTDVGHSFFVELHEKYPPLKPMFNAKNLCKRIWCANTNESNREQHVFDVFLYLETREIIRSKDVFLSPQAVFVSCVLHIWYIFLFKVSYTWRGYFFCVQRNLLRDFVSFRKTHNVNERSILYVIEYLFNKEYTNKKN